MLVYRGPAPAVQKRSGWHGGVGHNIESPRTVHGTPIPDRDSRFNGWHGDESNVDSQACPPRTLPRPLQSLAQGEEERHNYVDAQATLSTLYITVFHVIYHHVTVHHRKTNYPTKKPA